MKAKDPYNLGPHRSAYEQVWFQTRLGNLVRSDARAFALASITYLSFAPGYIKPSTG